MCTTLSAPSPMSAMGDVTSAQLFSPFFHMYLPVLKTGWCAWADSAAASSALQSAQEILIFWLGKHCRTMYLDK